MRSLGCSRECRQKVTAEIVWLEVCHLEAVATCGCKKAPSDIYVTQTCPHSLCAHCALLGRKGAQIPGWEGQLHNEANLSMSLMQWLGPQMKSVLFKSLDRPPSSLVSGSCGPSGQSDSGDLENLEPSLYQAETHTSDSDFLSLSPQGIQVHCIFLKCPLLPVKFPEKLLSIDY